MTRSRIYTVFVGLLFSTLLYSQTTEPNKLDSELTNLYKTLIQTNSPSQQDSTATLFKKRLIEQLQHPATFENAFDSLSRYLTIKTSPDKKIRFYSWDDHTGGSWHSIHCISQFKTKSGKIVVQQLGSGNETETGEFTDSEIFEVHEWTEGKTTFYLTFGQGTHGSGHQHQIARVFTIQSDKLVLCNSCFEHKSSLIIEYPRGSEAKLVFNKQTREISYNEFKLNDTGNFDPTGKTVTLKREKGNFTHVK